MLQISINFPTNCDINPFRAEPSHRLVEFLKRALYKLLAAILSKSWEPDF